MASWANSLPTAKKVYHHALSPGMSQIQGHTSCQHVLFVHLWQILFYFLPYKERNSKHLPLPLIHGRMFRFLLLVGPNLPWHHFPWSQIFGVLQQMRNRFQGVACVAQSPQGRLPGLVPFIFRCERRNSSGSRGRECSQLKAWTSQPKDWMRSQLTTMSH